jgi:hypothetical protein
LDHHDLLFQTFKANFRIEVTPQNKRQLDEIIHNLVKTTYKNCPKTWQEVKKRIAEDEDESAQKLKSAWDNRQP